MSLLHRMKKAARASWKIITAPSYEEMVTAERAAMRTRTLQKATNMISQSSKRYYMTEQDEVEALEYRAKQLNNDPMRRAIYSVNSYLNIFGIPRPNFWKSDNDRLARNAIYAVCEKRIMDTIETAEWEVTNGNKQPVESAEKFLKKPNPQDTFQVLIKQTIPDILRYDQAAWVKVRSIAGNLLELKAYSGPEFWIEVDNKFGDVMGQYGLNYFGPWSHGYVKKYWQHSRPGVYIPFAPNDICFIMMYKRADSIYGTDFIQQLKWQLEYMIDSTKAAGMTFANGIGPSLVWKHPDLSSIEQLEERNMEVELENKGPENFGNILHLLGQEEISTVFPELMHMQWLEGQKFISSIIWAMFGFSESEFTSGDANRATAYINQNITKSKMLAPILRHLETVINTEVLPELDGYQPDWEFRFKPIVELDDLLKEIQVEQGRADVTTKWVNAGVPLEEAMRMAKVDEDHIKAVTEAVDRVSQQDNQSMEAALQNLKQADITQELAGEGDAASGNQPDQGGKPHSEGYSGQARSDSGWPEDDGQKKKPFGKADFKESEHPRADDGKFGDKIGEQGTAQEESKPVGDAGRTPGKQERILPKFKNNEEIRNYVSDSSTLKIAGSLTGIKTEFVAKLLSETLNINDKLKEPIKTDIEFGGVRQKAYAVYDPVNNRLIFKKREGDVGKHLQSDNEVWAKYNGEEIPFHASTTHEGMVAHEFGHAIDKAHGFKFSQEIDKLSLDERKAYSGISGYGRSDLFGIGFIPPCRETFAECFSAVVTNSARAQFVPQKMKDMIMEIFK